MVRRKFRFLVTVITVFILTFGLVGPALAAGNPEPAGGARWIVQFEDEVNLPAKQRIIDNAGGFIEQELDALNMAIVFLPSQAAAGGLERVKGVRWVEEDSYRYYDDVQPLPWGIDRIDAEEVWGGNTGAGVNVAVLDSGIDTNHPDLQVNIAGGYSAVNRDTTNFEDKNGHGTHVAGIIAAVNNLIGVVGVGPDIDLYAVQISKGGRIRLTDIVEGINWTIGTLPEYGDTNPDNDIQVINMSFGGGYSKSEATALKKAYDAGIVLVSSAGNASGGAVNYPAALDWVIAVSAVDKYDQIASFSSVGSEVELAAPGRSIYSTYKDGSYVTLSGTSMASPHVAGVAALVIASGITDANNNGLINDEVRTRLQTTAFDLGTPGQDNLYGYGLVDAEKAVLGTTSGNNFAIDTGSIGGTVTDTSTSDAIAGATVTVEGTSLSATTASNGSYLISGVPVGTYTVTASAGGYQSQSANNVAVTKDTTTTAVDFALTTATPVSVASITYDTEGGRYGDKHLLITVALNNQVSGASVSIELFRNGDSLGSATGTTGTDGTVTFSLKNAPSGTYTTTVTGVTADGLTWDGITPDNEFPKP